MGLLLCLTLLKEVWPPSSVWRGLCSQDPGQVPVLTLEMTHRLGNGGPALQQNSAAEIHVCDNDHTMDT